MFVTSLNASCRTMRNSKQLHFDPGKIAVMVVSGSAAHPSNCTHLWCSKQPHSTRKIILGKLRDVAQAQTTGRLTFARSRTKAQPLILCFCSSSKSLHFHQYFPHCTLSSSMSPVGGVALDAILLLPLPGAVNVGMSAIGLSLVTFLGIKKNIVVQACCGHLPLCSTFSRNSTISLLGSFVKSKGTFGWNPSRPTPVSAVYNPDAFSRSHSFGLGEASSNFFNSSFSKDCPPHFAHFRHTANALPILSSSPRNSLTTSFIFLQYLHSSPPHCWLRYLVKKSSTAFLRSLFSPPFADASPPFFLFHLFSACVPAIHTISAWCPSHPCVGPCMLSHNLSQASPRPTNGFGHPCFLFDLIFLISSCMMAILCCCFISSSSVCSSGLLCSRCKLYYLNFFGLAHPEHFLHHIKTSPCLSILTRSCPPR